MANSVAGTADPRRCHWPPTSLFSRPMARVLVVDDSALFLEMAVAALREVGLEAIGARDLAELEARLDAPPYDLILMDLHMPEAFGDDVAGVLRHVRGIPTPIYLISHLAEEELARRAADARVEGYITKRHGMDALVATVRRILNRA